MAVFTSIGLALGAAGAAATAVGVGAAALGAVAVSKLAKKPKMPDAPPTVDPAIERGKAEAEAAQAANSKLAVKNRARAASSLLAKPLDTLGGELGAGPGKTTLGQ